MSASRLITLVGAVAAASVIVASCKEPGGPPPPITQPPTDTTKPPTDTTTPPPAGNAVTLWAAGNVTACQPGDHDAAVAALIVADPNAKVLAVGDLANRGSVDDFNNCYNASWGQFKDRTFPVLGNHEYDYFELDPTRPAGQDTVRKAIGAFTYWGAQLGTNGDGGKGGFYATNYGAWHIIVVNDNWNVCNAGTPTQYHCVEGFTAGPGSAYFQWIAAELASAKAANKCTLVAFHSPRFFSSRSAGFTVRSQRRTLWDVLEIGGADVVVNGQEHHYERLAPMKADGTADATKIRSFNVGTGGESVTPDGALVAIHPNSEVRVHQYGALKLSLGATGYSWSFMPADGTPAADTGSGTCH
jgi:hypothetical protein